MKEASDLSAIGNFAMDSIFNETAQLYEGAVDTVASGKEGIKSAVNATITKGACSHVAKSRDSNLKLNLPQLKQKIANSSASLSKGNLSVFSILPRT